jgi:hypothetical protein
MFLTYFNVCYLLFVFRFGSQNTYSTIKVEISNAKKKKKISMVNVKINLEYFTLPDNDFTKKVKHVAISYTEKYHQT